MYTVFLLKSIIGSYLKGDSICIKQILLFTSSMTKYLNLAVLSFEYHRRADEF